MTASTLRSFEQDDHEAPAARAAGVQLDPEFLMSFLGLCARILVDLLVWSGSSWNQGATIQ